MAPLTPPGERRARAAATSATSAAQRRHPADVMRRAGRELEQLGAQLDAPDRHQLTVHQVDERLREIFAEAIGAIRGPDAARAVHAPLGRIGSGYIW